MSPCTAFTWHMPFLALHPDQFKQTEWKNLPWPQRAQTKTNTSILCVPQGVFESGFCLPLTECPFVVATFEDGIPNRLPLLLMSWSALFVRQTCWNAGTVTLNCQLPVRNHTFAKSLPEEILYNLQYGDRFLHFLKKNPQYSLPSYISSGWPTRTLMKY